MKGALLLIALCGCEAWGVDPDLERMIDQSRVEAYERSTLLPDGRGMRAPPPHTIAREQAIGPARVIDGVSGGVYATELPYAVDRDLIALGRSRFDIVCATCHGVLGDGDSKVAENMRLRKPPSLLADAVRAYPPGRIFQVASRGYGLMPGFAAQLTIEERWAVVAYLRALQLSRGVPLAELPPAVRREAEEALGAR